MNIKRSIIFRLEHRKKDGVLITENVPIRMCVTFEGSRIDFGTGYRIDESNWDPVCQRVRKGSYNKQHQSFADINATLSRYESVVHDIFKEFEVDGHHPTEDEVRIEFLLRMQPQVIPKRTTRSPLKKFTEFMLDMGKKNNWTQSTSEKFLNVKHHLEQYKKNLTFNDLTEDGLSLFVVFLVNQKKMRNSTIEHQIDCVKMFLRWCYKKGYINDRAFETFRPRLKQPRRRVIFLTPQELRTLIDLKIPASKAYLDRVRDVFIFMCFTGLRHSDAYNLHRSNIVNDDHLEITTIKTHDSLVIELNKYSKAILDKYKNIRYPEDKALPVISNQRMNDYLKDLAMLAGFNDKVRMVYYNGNERVETECPKYELISTHVARRTFVCTALAFGIPPNVVMKWTGHCDYKSMKPYIDIADDIRTKSMKNFDNFNNLL
jgi:integrase